MSLLFCMPHCPILYFIIFLSSIHEENILPNGVRLDPPMLEFGEQYVYIFFLFTCKQIWIQEMH